MTASPARRNWPDLVVFAAAALLLAAGWQHRQDSLLDAEKGLGYALGILGGTMMLALLLYPLRKKARWMANFGSVPFWFRTHMFLGVLGPVVVLFHSNFQLGSLNSNVALFAMLAVACSGFIGRYLYTRVHRGLYENRASLSRLRAELETGQKELADTLVQVPAVRDILTRFEREALAPTAGALAAFARAMVFGARAKLAVRSAAQAVRAAIAEDDRRHDALHYVDAHLRRVQRIAEFLVFDRLLSFWHLLHLPLFIMLVIAGWVHVLAVHMY